MLEQLRMDNKVLTGYFIEICCPFSLGTLLRKLLTLRPDHCCFVANLPAFLQRTACDRVRSRSSPCWNLVSDKLSSTTSPQRPKEWRRTWTSLALPQTSETLTSERIAIHLVCDESLHLCFCWVWALAKGFTGQEGKRAPTCTPPPI